MFEKFQRIPYLGGLLDTLTTKTECDSNDCEEEYTDEMDECMHTDVDVLHIQKQKKNKHQKHNTKQKKQIEYNNCNNSGSTILFGNWGRGGESRYSSTTKIPIMHFHQHKNLFRKRRKLKKIAEYQGINTFLGDGQYVYKLFSVQDTNKISSWLFELLGRKLIACMDKDLAQCIGTGTPCVVKKNLSLRMKHCGKDLHDNLPIVDPISFFHCAEILIRLTYALQKHNLIWLDMKPEQFVLTTQQSLKILDFEDLCHADIWTSHRGRIHRGTFFYLTPEERLIYLYGLKEDRTTNYVYSSACKGTSSNAHHNGNSFPTRDNAAAIGTYRLGLSLLVMATENENTQLQPWKCEGYKYTDIETREIHEAWVSRCIQIGQTNSPNLPSNFWPFIRQCIQFDWDKRPVRETLLTCINDTGLADHLQNSNTIKYLKQKPLLRSDFLPLHSPSLENDDGQISEMADMNRHVDNLFEALFLYKYNESRIALKELKDMLYDHRTRNDCEDGYNSNSDTTGNDTNMSDINNLLVLDLLCLILQRVNDWTTRKSVHLLY